MQDMEIQPEQSTKYSPLLKKKLLCLTAIIES